MCQCWRHFPRLHARVCFAFGDSVAGRVDRAADTHCFAGIWVQRRPTSRRSPFASLSAHGACPNRSPERNLGHDRADTVLMPLSGQRHERHSDQLREVGQHQPKETTVEVELLDRAGVIVPVNSAWDAFSGADGGDPARVGVGVSYLEVCAASGGEPVAERVAAAIRTALQVDLPAPMAVEVPCHSPDTSRWLDTLISSRLDDDARCLGATVTLSLARSVPQASQITSGGRSNGLRPAIAAVQSIEQPEIRPSGITIRKIEALVEAAGAPYRPTGKRGDLPKHPWKTRIRDRGRQVAHRC